MTVPMTTFSELPHQRGLRAHKNRTRAQCTSSDDSTEELTAVSSINDTAYRQQDTDATSNESAQQFVQQVLKSHTFCCFQAQFGANPETFDCCFIAFVSFVITCLCQQVATSVPSGMHLIPVRPLRTTAMEGFVWALIILGAIRLGRQQAENTFLDYDAIRVSQVWLPACIRDAKGNKIIKQLDRLDNLLHSKILPQRHSTVSCCIAFLPVQTTTSLSCLCMSWQ